MSVHTLLLVEDNAAIRGFLAAALEDEGYEVVVAEDGGVAIAMLRARRPPPDDLCLVILDMMLPVANGLLVLQELAELGSYVPVLAFSADPAMLERATAGGALSTLEKPFDLDRLLAVVERNCGK
jgi:DNA-binding response OmpR family regulator